MLFRFANLQTTIDNSDTIILKTFTLTPNY
jgi:hypothetical protein